MYRVDVRGELFSRFTMGFYRLLSLFFLKFCAASGSPALIYNSVYVPCFSKKLCGERFSRANL